MKTTHFWDIRQECQDASTAKCPAPYQACIASINMREPPSRNYIEKTRHIFPNNPIPIFPPFNIQIPLMISCTASVSLTNMPHTQCNWWIYSPGICIPYIYIVRSFPVSKRNLFKCNLLLKERQKKIHTAAGIRWWSPTQLLTSRRAA